MEYIMIGLGFYIIGALTLPLLIFLRARRCSEWDDSNMTNIYRLIAHIAVHPSDFGKMYFKDGTKPFWYISEDELSEVVRTRPENVIWDSVESKINDMLFKTSVIDDGHSLTENTTFVKLTKYVKYEEIELSLRTTISSGHPADVYNLDLEPLVPVNEDKLNLFSEQIKEQYNVKKVTIN